ncbi:MAG: triose-phosphate isomerase [Methanobacteriota archaeon]|nr:MAG: triose-phosphate isomerase [Euryarchaeota archaeon]
MKTPVIIINFKVYAEATGEKAVRLATIAKNVADKSGVCIAVACQPTDIAMVANTGVPTLAQHVDPIHPGNHTGHILGEAIREAGAIGSLVNHSERQQTLAAIEKSLEILKRLGMVSVVCTNNVKTSKAVATLEPDFIAIEPPELIGTGIPVSKAKPEIVKNGVEAVKTSNPDVKVLCGAGITTREDICAALRLGAEGVLIASAVTCSNNPKKVLEELVQGVKRA